MSRPCELSPERVLVLAPTGRDAVMIEERLAAAGFACEICGDLHALVAALKNDAGMVLIATEALGMGQTETLVAALDAQGPWSDVPVILLSLAPSKRRRHADPSIGLLARANVMFLQRPMPVDLLVSAVRSAVRARRRQYQMRDLYRELSRAVQLSEMFVGILGHDLRTPLGAIRTSAEVIVRSSDDTRSLRPAGRILSSADRMVRMIDQLLDLARVRQGRGIQLQVAPTDLGELARDALQEIGDANPQARFASSSSGDLNGRWDADRLGQVISNLVGNAVQHGDPAHPVSVELDGNEPSTVRLRVANAGAISEQALPILFEPFERAPGAKAAKKGLGLGLFIAREIARAHGGEITARTADGRTVLEVTLPREARPTETDVLTPP